MELLFENIKFSVVPGATVLVITASLPLELYVKEINVKKYELPVHRWKIFVDANTGEILNKLDLVQTAIVSGIVEGGVKDEPYGLEFNRPLEHVEVQISGVGSTYTEVTRIIRV